MPLAWQLHKAAANGEVECLAVLKEFGAIHIPNMQGNFPCHWAAQNSKLDALRFLAENYDVDMLVKNTFGRSTLTEAFQTNNADIIEFCLSHDSSSEERLLEPSSELVSSATSSNYPGDADCDKTSSDTQHAVLHCMCLDKGVIPTRTVRIRELPISRPDNPFGTDVAPQDDTTGWKCFLLSELGCSQC